MTAQKVPLYSLPDLKSAIDTAIPTLLTTLPKPYTFTQSHYYSTIRLALGYSAVLIAGALFAADYKYGWEVTKPWTLPACVLYFVLNGILTVWVWGVENGVVFVGRREGGQQLTLRSHIQKPTPEYILTVHYAAPSGTPIWQDTVVSVPFAKLFNTHGFLQKKELTKWLAREVEVVGHADPKAKVAVMEWEKENGIVAQDDANVMSGGLVKDVEGDTIEVASGGSEGEDGMLVGGKRSTRARSKSPLPEGAVSASGTPSKRGPGRPKKRA